jgi:ABC-type multidrug transport system fused ATPase/permease subunit
MVLKQLVITFMSVAGIVLPRYIIDSSFISRDYSAGMRFIYVFVGITLFGGVLSSFLSNKILLCKMIVYKEFQLFIGRRMMEADYQHIESENFLNIKEKASKFLYGNGSFAGILEASMDVFGKTLVLISTAAIISSLGVKLFLLLLLTIFASAWADARSKKKNIIINMERIPIERRGLYFAGIMADFRYGKEIRIYNLIDWLSDKYNKLLNHMQGFYEKTCRNNFRASAVGILLSSAQQFIIYVVLLFKAMSGLITVGAFTMFINSVYTFSSAIKDIAAAVIDMSQYNIYYAAFEEYLSIPQRARSGNLKPDFDKNNLTIRFDKVSYKYPGQENYALRDVNIEINPAEKIAIAGENGAGKTTFIKLLTRIYQPSEGAIYINGIDIQEIDYGFYTSLFAVTFQDFKLFSVSLKENVALSDSSAEDSEVLGVLKKSGFENKIENLKNGVNTSVFRDFDMSGFVPSGGESQKIAIAAALYKDSPIVILDEPTAALDPQAEYNLYTQFDSLFSNKIAIYISHRLSSTKFCDKIITIDKGRIAEFGSHEDLMLQDKLYARLFKMQAELYFARKQDIF